MVGTFALHNYIRINLSNDQVFQILEQLPVNELSCTTSTNEENIRQRYKMKDGHDWGDEYFALAKWQN